jgi:hypothetical protein
MENSLARAWDDFGWQSMGNFLRYGNIPIVMTLDAEIMLVIYRGEFGGASLVNFPRRMSRRSFPGRTFCFPPKKPKIGGDALKLFLKLPR